MPPHGHYGQTSDIRWVLDGPGPFDGHWERRCPDCVTKKRAAWWDLTLEFWNPRTLLRCRECDREHRSKIERDRLSTGTVRERRNAQQRRYYHRNRTLQLAKQTLRRAGTAAR